MVLACARRRTRIHTVDPGAPARRKRAMECDGCGPTWGDHHELARRAAGGWGRDKIVFHTGAFSLPPTFADRLLLGAPSDRRCAGRPAPSISP
jgi:hypothetical protein